MGGKLSRCISALVVVLVSSISSVGAAHAQERPAFATPMECFQAWDQDGETLDYIGDGWVDAPVARAGGVFLGCGDIFSGVIHIGHPETSGHLHPIHAETQAMFISCFQVIATSGSRRPDEDFPESRTRAEYTYTVETQFGPVPQVATIIYDNAGDFVWTMFTNTANAPRGNNWAGCTSALA